MGIKKALRATTCLAGGAGLALAAMAGPASAQEQDIEALRSQVETLMQRIEQLEAQQQQDQQAIEEARQAAAEATPRVVPDRSPVTLEVSGRINQAILYADNGEDDGIFIADNDNSGSRFGLTGTADMGPWTSTAYLEASFEVNTTDEISFEDEGGPIGTGPEEGEDFLSVRHAEWFLEHERFGELALGFGAQATEEITEIDLSGVGCCLSESDVDDTAGGLAFESVPGAPTLDVDEVFSNLDGDRTSRVGYSSPSLFGFNLAFALSQEDRGLAPDAAIRYAGEFADFEFEAGVGWRQNRAVDSDTFAGSASVLAPFGTNLTFAGGVESIDDDSGSVLDENPNFFFVKIGQRLDFFDFGQTRFFFDYFNGEGATDDVDALTDPLDPFETETLDTTSFGGGVVQVVDDLSSEFYVGVRSYDVDFPGGFDDPDNLIAVISGARVRF